MSAQDDEKTEDEQDTKSSDEHDEHSDGEAHDSDDEHEHDSDDEHESDDDDDKYTGEHGEDMSEIGQVSKDKVPDEPSDEGKEEVEKIAEAYSDKKTAVMPGTERTISGTAVNEWLDDEGNPKFGDPDEHPFAEDGEDGDGQDGDGGAGDGHDDQNAKENDTNEKDTKDKDTEDHDTNDSKKDESED